MRSGAVTSAACAIVSPSMASEPRSASITMSSLRGFATVAAIVKYASEPSTRSRLTASISMRGGFDTGSDAQPASTSAATATTTRLRSGVVRALDIEPEVHDVAVADHVVPAFEAHAASLLRALLAAMRHVVGIADHFRTNEAAFEVGVDDAGGLRRRRAMRDRPCAHLLRA